MFSRPVKVGTRRKCWCTMPMPNFSASAGARMATGRPRQSNAAGIAGVDAGQDFIRVDLPAPFSPRRAWTSPGATANEDVVEHRDTAECLGNALHDEGPAARPPPPEQGPAACPVHADRASPSVAFSCVRFAVAVSSACRPCLPRGSPWPTVRHRRWFRPRRRRRVPSCAAIGPSKGGEGAGHDLRPDLLDPRPDVLGNLDRTAARARPPPRPCRGRRRRGSAPRCRRPSGRWSAPGVRPNGNMTEVRMPSGACWLMSSWKPIEAAPRSSAAMNGAADDRLLAMTSAPWSRRASVTCPSFAGSHQLLV